MKHYVEFCKRYDIVISIDKDLTFGNSSIISSIENEIHLLVESDYWDKNKADRKSSSIPKKKEHPTTNEIELSQNEKSECIVKHDVGFTKFDGVVFLIGKDGQFGKANNACSIEKEINHVDASDNYDTSNAYRNSYSVLKNKKYPTA